MQIQDPKLQFTGAFQTRSKTDLIVLHHAAATKCTIQDVHRWHLSKDPPWLGCGYHYFVDKQGQIWRGRPEWAMGAHAEGVNDRSVGICTEGDFTKETMPAAQQQSIIELVRDVLTRYPACEIKRHSEVNATLCPGQYFPFIEIMTGATVVIGTPIISEPRATVEQAQAWARRRGATDQFIALVPAFWRLAQCRGKVDPAGAYAQSFKETAGGRFTGVLDASYMNTGGFKTSQGGADGDPNAHQRFSSWEDGIAAHLDHLALYAGAVGYPRTDTTDPRHFPYIAGVAQTFEALGGRWAPSADYGTSIVKDYLADLLSEPEPADDATRLAAENAILREQIQVLTAAVTLRDGILDKVKALVATL